MKRTSTDAEYLDSGRVVIDADGIPVELGYRGTGSPEGKVSAPVGSIYTDAVATNGAIRWIKTSGTGATGWQVEYGDTGWRDMSSSLPYGWAGTNGRLRILRSGNTVHVSASNLRPQGTGNQEVIQLPLGFRPTHTANAAYFESDAAGQAYCFSYAPYSVTLYGVEAANSFVNITTSFLTSNPWPPSLPGTPA